MESSSILFTVMKLSDAYYLISITGRHGYCGILPQSSMCSWQNAWNVCWLRNMW